MPFFWYEQEEGRGFVRPLGHKNGLYMYYQTRKELIEKALREENFSSNEIPDNAPLELKALAPPF
jgi:hypothetical protein